MTCEEARERLPDQLLGTLSPAESSAVASHLRGCAACRAEVAALGDGVAAFARAAHDRTPPEELRSRVGDVLQAEWAAPAAAAGSRARRPTTAWVAAAAAIIAVVASVSWGFSQHHDAQVAAAESSSYSNLLRILGGKEFRAGRLVPAPGLAVEGSVIVYDSHEDQSWAAVFVRAPGSAGHASATLDAADGRTIDIWPLRIQPDGDGSSWIVTSADLTAFDHLTVRSADGSVIATAQIDAA